MNAVELCDMNNFTFLLMSVANNVLQFYSINKI